MSNPNQSVRTCKLKVDLKCCTGCQKKASTKLQTISGVSAVEYNKEKGIMTVTGDVEPMTLVHKLTRWGKKAALVSVNYQLDDDDLLSDSEEDFNDEDEEEEWDTDPKPMERETKKKKKKKKGILRKSSLLGCFGSKSPKVVLPYPRQNQNQQRPFPHMQPHPHPMMQQRPPFRMMNHQPMMQPPPHPMMRQQQPQPMMQQQPHPMMWQQQPQAQMMMMPPQGPMMGATMPMAYNGNMFQPGPPQARPYFMKDLKVNPSLHYQKS